MRRRDVRVCGAGSGVTRREVALSADLGCSSEYSFWWLMQAPSLAEACCWPEWLRTGVEQASIPTVVEYGSVDCKPDGNAHGYGKGCEVWGLGSGFAHWQRAPRWFSPHSWVPHGVHGALCFWVRLGARLCLAGVANRQTNLIFRHAGARVFGCYLNAFSERMLGKASGDAGVLDPVLRGRVSVVPLWSCLFHLTAGVCGLSTDMLHGDIALCLARWCCIGTIGLTCALL